MKKTIAAVLVGVAVLSLAACGGNDGPVSVTEVTVFDTDAPMIQPTVKPEDEFIIIETDATVTETSSGTVVTETEIQTSSVTTTGTTAVTTTTAPVTTPAETVAPAARPADYPQIYYTRDQLEAVDNTKYGWGQGVHVDSLNRPTGCTNWQNTYGGYSAIYIMPETEPARLTFDLGYEYGCTGRVLDTLNAKGVKGTFFVTMHYVTSNPDLVRRMIDEGHIVGNHSVNHLSMPTLSIDEMEAEIMGLHDYVRDNFGYEMYLFRPPMGEQSARSLAVTQNLGYRSVFWSYTYLDYDVNNQKPEAEAYELVTRNAHKGAVYLLHGISETNTAILGDLIDYLNSSGIGVASSW